MRGRTLITLVTSLILLSLVASWVVAEVFTSSSKIVELADLEDHLLEALRRYIDAEYDNLKALSAFLMDRSKEFRLQSHETQLQAVQHPNGAYHLMKLYADKWAPKMESLPSFRASLDQLASRLPSQEDFVGAQKALVRLQYIYNMNVTNMYNGNYLGYFGPPLEATNAYQIGRQAFMDGFLEQSRQWLELAAEKLKEKENESYTLAWNLALLGRVFYLMNNTEKAQCLYNESIRLDPKSGDVVQLARELSGEEQTMYGHSTTDWHANMSQLCSRDKAHRVAEIRPYHVCRYKPSLHCPYMRYKEEILSTMPYASVFYDIVTDTEIDALKGFVYGKMFRGAVGQGKESRTADIRTSDLGWIYDKDLPVAAALSQKVKAITWLEVDQRDPEGPSSSEALQVVNYGLGGHYDAHMDPFDQASDEPLLRHSGERIATFLIYLSDVEKGGHTVFLRSGISVAPLKGMALLWYNYEPHMNEMQKLTVHAGCPVMYGHKWIANKWLWTYGNTFRRPCGQNVDATQLEIEQLVQSRGGKSPRAACVRTHPQRG